MSTNPKGRTRKIELLEQMLSSRRDDLRNHIHGHLGDVHVDREPDDEAAQASDSVTKDLTVATLERERRLLDEIEYALDRIKRGTYGTCAFCNIEIPDARLRALPWARLCINCADRAAKGISAAAD
jgi:DnaK suppressor protein